MEIPPDQAKAYEIFFPWAAEQMAALKERAGRFVHYTSAEVALSIITNKIVWMRNARTMNDFSEIEHGKSCLFEAYKSEPGVQLKAFLERLYPGMCAQLEEAFNGWLPDLDSNTFLTSFSEHLDNEDQIGRLSMWRAYGRRNGVAIVFNNRPFLAPSDALKAYSSPVAYLSKKGFAAEFARMVALVVANEDYISQLGRDVTLANVFTIFRYSVLCTKHPGFAEEKEWRVIYSPGYERSDHITHHIEIVNGIPQQVCKIPLKNVPEEGFEGAELPELLDRVIIGPTEYGLTMYDAFVDVLTANGVAEPANKVWVSDIPIRES